MAQQNNPADGLQPPLIRTLSNEESKKLLTDKQLGVLI